MIRILVVDDDLQVARLFATALEKVGYNVTVVYSGSEALKSLAADEFALVVLDLSMPAPDGFEVLRALKAQGKTPPPVIMVSGALDNALLRASEFLGAAASLQKSEGPGRLVELARQLLERNRIHCA